MATAQGLARVAQINATIAKQGYAAPNPTAGKNAVTLSNQSSANPADRYSPNAVKAEPTDVELGLKPAEPPNTADTQIPSTAPNYAQVNAPNQAIQATPEQVSAVASATKQVNDLATRIKQGRATAISSGATPPPTAGEAAMATNAYIPPPPPVEPPSVVGNLMNVDDNFDSILTGMDELMSPVAQKTSLLDEYNQLSKSLGIQSLNAELINEKNIIEGTEDDIRNEVMAAGGFATDSQVLALANARNKSLIKNYNTLLDTRNNAEQQLNTMMNLSVQDRKMASEEFDRKLNYAFKVTEFKQKAVDNARSMLTNFANTMGWDAMLSAATPQEQANISKLFGLSPVMLSQMASQSATQRLTKQRETALDLATKEQQLRNLQLTGQKTAQELSATGTEGQSPYQAERQYRTLQSVDELGILARANPKIFGRTAALPLPNFLRSDAYRSVKAQLDTLKASIAFGELTAMREASKTGGALGQVSNVEERLLSSALGALDMAQSPEAFNSQLTKIKNSIIRWQNAQQQYGTASMPTITAPTGEQIIITD